MAIVLSLTFLVPSFFETKQSVATRDIDVGSIGTLSYEEKVNKLLATFDDYSVENNDTSITFEASTDISGLDFSGIQYLSTNAEITVKRYRTNLDIENKKFEVVTEYIQDEKTMFCETIETTPYYDEYTDDYYIEMPDGTSVSVSESLSHDNFNECSATLVLAGTAVAVLLAAVVIVAAPVISEVVEVVVVKIVSWVRSFWGWFRSLWTSKTTTQTTTTVTISLSYSVTIANTKYEAKPYDKTKKYDASKYYVAIADTDDGLLYVSTIPVDTLSALAVLTSSSYVKSAHKGSNKSFVISLYSADATGASACLIATQAGTILGSAGAVFHDAKKLGYFNHYHPGANYSSISHPHVFFGTPKA